MQKLSYQDYCPTIPETSGYIYLIYFPKDDEYKIGKTKNLRMRFAQLFRQHGYKPEVIHFFYTNEMDRAESYLHYRFMNKAIVGTPRHKNNNSEYYHLSPEDVAYIQSL